jgi:hypothetical protein
VSTVAKAALEAITVEEGHEELEVLFLAVVRSRGQEEEVARESRQELTESVALRVLDLAAEIGSGHLVGLVTDDQVPPTLRDRELGLDVLVARQLVQAGDDEICLEKPVAGPGCFQLVVGEDLEWQVEAAIELVLPLLRKAARAHNEAALKVASGDELLHQEAGHDCLTCPRVVRQEESQRLAGQHLLIDGGDLVRKRVNEGSVNRENRVEQVSEPDAVRLRNEAKQRPVAVEAPRATALDDFNARLVVAIQEFVGDLAVRILVRQLERLGTEPLGIHYGHECIRQDSPHRSAGG